MKMMTVMMTIAFPVYTNISSCFFLSASEMRYF